MYVLCQEYCALPIQNVWMRIKDNQRSVIFLYLENLNFLALIIFPQADRTSTVHLKY